MKTIYKKVKLITLILIIAGFSFNTQAQNYVWAKNMGGASSNQRGEDIAVDASGNVYTIGYFEETADFDPGSNTFDLTTVGEFDVFISKLDASGNFVWAKQLGGTDEEEGYSITVDASGNVYTTGFFNGTVDFDPSSSIFNLTAEGGSDIFISKLDASGNFVWAKNIGGEEDDAGNSITVDASGNIYLTGYFEETVDFDPNAGTFNLTSISSNDIFVVKLDASGNLIWAKHMGGTSSTRGEAIVLDESGNSYITGGFGGTTDFDPNSGIENLTAIGNTDIFVVKLDALGNYIWAKSIGGSENDEGFGIAVDASGNVYTTGYFRTTVDFDPGAGTESLSAVNKEDIFISKLDASGNYVWARNMGGANFDRGFDITADASGNIYATGNFNGTVDFDAGVNTENLTAIGNDDIFILKLDASGNYVWAKNMGGTSYDIGFGIAVDASDNIYTVGDFRGVADFDPNSGTENLTALGIIDTFVSKLSQPSLTLSTTALSDLNATILNASDTQTFTISGSNLAADVSISSSTTDWELSTDGTNFSNTLSLPQSGGVLTGQPITVYIRLKSGLSLGAKTATLSISSMDATIQNITLDGTVNKDDQTITFEALGIKIVEEADFDLTATASSGLDIAYTSSNTAVATISGSTVSIVGIGTSEITASQVGNDSYNAATDVTQILTVTTLTSLSNLENQIIKTYPNPTAGKLIIENLPAGQVTFSLSDTRGSEIFRGVAEKSLELDLSKLPAGVYTLTLNTNEGSFSSKILKQ